METYGSRRQVWNRTAKMTRGKLLRSDLRKNKWGRIVSKKKSVTAKKEKRLVKAGYGAKKGSFGYVYIEKQTKNNKKTKKVKKLK